MSNALKAQQENIMTKLYVLAYLRNGDKILLLRRLNASFADGLYSLPGGKIEPDETALKAIKREIQEETGLEIPESAFELVHTFHRKGDDTTLIALCFRADVEALPAPCNNEPEKHDDIQFFKTDQLPENIIPAHKQAIECILKTALYSEHGW